MARATRNSRSLSMSSPSQAAINVTIAGVAGLLTGKGLSNAQIRQRIERTAVDKGKVGEDPAFGWGRINASSTVNGETAPTISNPRPAPEAKTKDRTPTMSATVRDKRTDLKKENISLFVNGSRVTGFTYNAGTDRLSFTPKN